LQPTAFAGSRLAGHHVVAQLWLVCKAAPLSGN